MKLAINGGEPIRENILNYGKQTIDESDKQACEYLLNLLSWLYFYLVFNFSTSVDNFSHSNSINSFDVYLLPRIGLLPSFGSGAFTVSAPKNTSDFDAILSIIKSPNYHYVY